MKKDSITGRYLAALITNLIKTRIPETIVVANNRWEKLPTLKNLRVLILS